MTAGDGCANMAVGRSDSTGGGRVAGKVAIVTGGASGLGKAIAARLAAEGARVVITDLDAVRGEQAVEEIGRGTLFIQQDVTEEAEWDTLIARMEREYGGFQILVNNAGLGNQHGRTNPEETTLARWRESVRVNGEGVFLGCRSAIAAMRATGGSIVNISSIAALVPTPPIAAYGFAKAGVEQFSKSVALHCAERGYRIRCNSVHPGQIETPMLAGLFENVAADLNQPADKVRETFLKKVPLGEFGSADDVAFGVLYLACDEARHVTGTRLVIDGGMSLIN